MIKMAGFTLGGWGASPPKSDISAIDIPAEIVAKKRHFDPSREPKLLGLL